MKKTLALLLTSVSLTLALPAIAQDSIIDEARFGGTWAQPDWMDNNHTEADQVAINAQLLLKPVNIDFFGLVEDDASSFLTSIMNPRPHIGATANFDDNGTSYINAGLTWHFELTDSFFMEAGFGGAWNNGSDIPTATRAGIGSHWVFHESLAFGANITENVTFLIQYDHLSHRDLAGSINRGLNNLSARVGVKF